MAYLYVSQHNKVNDCITDYHYGSLTGDRRFGYEFFKATHIFGAVVFIVTFFWHCDYTLTSWYGNTTGVQTKLHVLKHSQGLLHRHSGNLCPLLRIPMASNLLRIWSYTESYHLLGRQRLHPCCHSG
jgi:hypothetical protein